MKNNDKKIYDEKVRIKREKEWQERQEKEKRQ